MARYHEYTYTTVDQGGAARQMEIVIASDRGRGYNVKFGATQTLWDAYDQDAFVASISAR